MAVIHDMTESFIFLPILVAFLILGIVIAIILVIRRQRGSRDLRIDTFLPPFVGGKVPKEETYVVPRNWKPSTNNRVYAPLSIPIESPTRSSSFSSSNFVQSIIHVLPPRVGTSDFV